MGRGGQVSMEFLLITGFSLLLLIPLIILFFTQSAAVRSELIEAQADTAARAMLDAAERVHYAGPPSRETISVRFPDHLKNVTIRNNSIILTVISPQEYDVVVASSVPLIQSTLQTNQGVSVLRVEATDTGVQFTEQ